MSDVHFLNFENMLNVLNVSLFLWCLLQIVHICNSLYHIGSQCQIWAMLFGIVTENLISWFIKWSTHETKPSSFILTIFNVIQEISQIQHQQGRLTIPRPGRSTTKRWVCVQVFSVIAW